MYSPYWTGHRYDTFFSNITKPFNKFEFILKTEGFIHKVYLQSRPLVIIVLTNVVRPYVLTFKHLEKQNKFHMKTMFATGKTVDLAEWIIDDTCLVLHIAKMQGFMKT